MHEVAVSRLSVPELLAWLGAKSPTAFDSPKRTPKGEGRLIDFPEPLLHIQMGIGNEELLALVRDRWQPSMIDPCLGSRSPVRDFCQAHSPHIPQTFFPTRR